MQDRWLLYVQDKVVDGLGSFLSGCLMQLAKYTIHNHCLFSLSATRVTTLWLKQPICFCCEIKGQKTKFPQGSMPLDPPSLPHALHTDTYLPPNYPYNLILLPPPSPLGKKLKETLA